VSTALTTARPDLAYPTQLTPVTLELTGLDPWGNDDLLQIVSSQADVSKRPLYPYSDQSPADGATSFGGTTDWAAILWDSTVSGLPEASANDVVFVHQAKSEFIETGGTHATLRRAIRWARLGDFNVADGAGATLSAALVAAPQTGRLAVDVKVSRFEALVPYVSPSARRLADCDKRTSLGMLAAGAAHEINNPMAYVTSNVKALAEAMQELDPLPPALRAYAEDPRTPPTGAARSRRSDALALRATP
jgi:signal transduction histidine kinase